MITIYALEYDDPFGLPVIDNLARTKEAARQKIETLHNLDPERYNKDNVRIIVFKVDMDRRTVRKGKTLIGIKDLQ